MPFGNTDDPADDLDDVVENAAGSQGYNSFNAAEAYLRGQLSIEFLIREKRVAGRDGHYYLAILQKSRVWREKLKRFSVPRFWSDDGVACGGPYWNNQTVLVSHAQAVQQNKSVGMEAKLISSFVWLQKLEKPDRSWAVLAEFLEALFFEIGSAPENRERQILKRAGLHTNGTDNKQIQGGAGVVDYISDNCAPSVRDRFMGIQDQLLRAIRVHMEPDLVRVACDKGVHLSIELCEVFLCPFYLGTRSETWVNIADGHVSPSDRGIRIL